MVITCSSRRLLLAYLAARARIPRLLLPIELRIARRAAGEGARGPTAFHGGKRSPGEAWADKQKSNCSNRRGAGAHATSEACHPERSEGSMHLGAANA